MIVYLSLITFIAIGGSLFAQETDDHRAIRAVIDQEQNANDSGDAQALLEVHTEDFIAVWARHYDGDTDWLQRYYHVTEAGFAVLTNGVNYRNPGNGSTQSSSD